MRQPLFLGVLDTHHLYSRQGEEKALCVQRQASGDASLARVTEVSHVQHLILPTGDFERLLTGELRPTMPPELAAMSLPDIVRLLPMLLCSHRAPILFLITDLNCSVQKWHAKPAFVFSGASPDRPPSSSSPLSATSFVSCLECALLPPSVVRRGVCSPAEQSARFRVFQARRALRTLGKYDDGGVDAELYDEEVETDEVKEAQLAAGPAVMHVGKYTVNLPRARTAAGVAALARAGVAWWKLVLLLSEQDDVEGAFAAHFSSLLPPVSEPQEERLSSSAEKRLFTLRAQHLLRAAVRRKSLLRVDIRAGTSAVQVLRSAGLTTVLATAAREQLYKAMGFLTNLVGASMSFNVDWALVAHPSFGSPMRRKHFKLAESIVMLDGHRHGIVPTPVRQARASWEAVAQLDPVLWRFKAFPPHLSATMSKLGQRLNVAESNLQLLATLPQAMATVLRSLPFLAGDTVLLFGPCREHSAIVSHLVARCGVRVYVSSLQEPLGSDDDLLVLFADCVARMRPRAVLMQHLLPTGRPLPLAPLASECRAANCVSIVDGSDALGNIKFNLGDLGVDFYMSRLDGYFFCPSGISVLYASPLRQEALSTLTVSYFHGEGYAREWTYTGLTDMSQWAAVYQALEFQQYICAGYAEYITYRANEANRMLCRTWHVESITPEPLCSGVFAVLLPSALEGAEDTDAVHLEALLAQDRVHVRVFSIAFRGAVTVRKRLAVRLTVSVYTDLEDIKKLAVTVLHHASSALRAASRAQTMQPNPTR